MNEKKIIYVIKFVKIYYYFVLNISINICVLNLLEYFLNELKSCINYCIQNFQRFLNGLEMFFIYIYNVFVIL